MDAELDQYLTSIFNVEIYEEIIERALFDSETEANSFFIHLFSSLNEIKANKIKPRIVADQITKEALKYPIKIESEFYQYLLRLLCNEYDETLHLAIKAINKAYINFQKEIGLTEIDFLVIDDYFRRHTNFYLDPVAPGITWENHTKIGKDPGLFNLPNSTEQQPEISEANGNKNEGNTARRQALALYYLNEHYNIFPEENKAAKARFAAFLTGKSYDNLYQVFKSPLGHISQESQRNDLLYIREIFKDTKNFKIITLIDNDLDSI